MVRNVGGIDRILRILVGVALLLWFLLDQIGGQTDGLWHWAKLIGAVPLLTGLFSFCPLYPIVGLNTCPLKK